MCAALSECRSTVCQRIDRSYRGQRLCLVSVRHWVDRLPACQAVGINMRPDAQDGTFATQQRGEAGESMYGWWTGKEELRPGRSGQGHGNFPSSDSSSLINLISLDRDFEQMKQHRMRGHISSRSFDVESSPIQTGRSTSGAKPCWAMTRVEAQHCLTKTTDDDRSA